MGGSGTPNWNEFLNNCWGWPDESFAGLPDLAAAANVVLGENPPYTLQDFLGSYPKWGGVTLSQQASVAQGSAQITLGDASGVAVGNLIAGSGIPDGTTVTAISGNILTLSAQATTSGSDVAVTIWNSPLIPFAVITAYIYLASQSLVQARWQATWLTAMGLFISHFCTLFAMTDGNPAANTAQAAAQGVATGIAISKSVGDVSIGYQAVGGLDQWAAWNLTAYGQMLVSLARVIGTGPMVLW